MNRPHDPTPLWRPLFGMAVALAVTTTMDATGLSMFSALPLLPLAGLFWFLAKYSRREMGMTLGTGEGYAWAVLYPVAVPGLLAGAALLGVNWGLMRWLSGSALVAAVSHAVWNALVYTLFGFGEKVGELGIAQAGIFGPEVGFLGLAGNGIFALILWRRIVARRG